MGYLLRGASPHRPARTKCATRSCEPISPRSFFLPPQDLLLTSIIADFSPPRYQQNSTVYHHVWPARGNNGLRFGRVFNRCEHRRLVASCRFAFSKPPPTQLRPPRSIFSLFARTGRSVSVPIAARTTGGNDNFERLRAFAGKGGGHDGYRRFTALLWRPLSALDSRKCAQQA